MKLLVKKNYKLITGMFWQIPDEGKRSLNLTKLSKDTKLNMYCQIKNLNQTYGFCSRESLQGEKNVASLGKFIIESSGLSASYLNSIICYKFKDSGELDENGKTLENDLYGYIVLLNGTISPDEGEYVSDFDAVKESILSKAKKHEIETLYLPSEVAGKFFGIFELLYDAYNNEELLQHLMARLSAKQRSDLLELINNELPKERGYQQLLDTPILDLVLLRSLIMEDAFTKQLKSTKDLNIKYLIPNIYTLMFTSDEVYWKNAKFKYNFNKAIVRSIAGYKAQKYKILALIMVLGFLIYSVYDYINHKELAAPVVAQVVPQIPKAVAVEPMVLINLCLPEVSDYLHDINPWEFNTMKCDTLGVTLSFSSTTATTIGDFEKLVGSSKNITFSGNSGTYSKKFPIQNYISTTKAMGMGRDKLLDKLQKDAIYYNLNLSTSNGSGLSANKFTITSKVSPLFLYNHGVLDNLRLDQISVSFDKSTGFYSWNIQGEI